MKRADAQIKAYGVDSTPTIIVNGKYRVTAVSAGGWDKVQRSLRIWWRARAKAPSNRTAREPSGSARSLA